jgi:hemolysin activation/secretion protein
MAKLKNKIVFFLLSLCVSQSAMAAELPGQANVNPANVMDNLNNSLPNIAKPAHSIANLSARSSHLKHKHTQTTDTELRLKKIVLLGASHPVPARVTVIYQALLGKKVSFTDIQMLAARMQQRYRDDGFILVQVILPPQEIEINKGVIKLQIIEGHIQNVILSGDDPFGAKAQLENYAQKIKDERPITYQTLNHFLTVANNLPGISVSSTIVPDPKVLGAADLVLKVSRKPVSAFVNFNNRGTQYIGPGQASAGLSLYDLLGADTLSLVGATSTTNPTQLAYRGISYAIVVGPYGTEINPSIINIATHPGGALTAFDMIGNSTKYTLAINQPLIAATSQNLILQGNLSHTNSSNNVYQTMQLYHDQITSLSLGLKYQDIFLQTYNDINLSTTIGMPILGALASEANPSITNGKTNFVKFNLLTTSIHYLTKRISVALNTQIQVTPQTMLSSEQIGYGGQLFGQGFIPYVISGDNGYMGALALRYDLPAVSLFDLLQPEIFYDAGSITFNHSLSGFSNASAQSAGFGVNMRLLKTWQLAFVIAKPLSITQTTNVNSGWNSFLNVTAVF